MAKTCPKKMSLKKSTKVENAKTTSVKAVTHEDGNEVVTQVTREQEAEFPSEPENCSGNFSLNEEGDYPDASQSERQIDHEK